MEEAGECACRMQGVPTFPAHLRMRLVSLGNSRRSLVGQPFSKSAIEHVQGHLVKKQVPPDLFQVCAGLVPAPAQPSGGPSQAAQVLEPGRLLLWLNHPPPTPSLSHILKKFARTSEETCSRNYDGQGGLAC